MGISMDISMDIPMDIHEKMDVDMGGKFHIHGKPVETPRYVVNITTPSGQWPLFNKIDIHVYISGFGGNVAISGCRKIASSKFELAVVGNPRFVAGISILSVMVPNIL